MSENAISMQELGKSYNGDIYAIHDISIEIPQGAVFGFLGPNGAGKTTTVKLLTGLLKPTKGSCLVLGVSPTHKPAQVHRLCGVVTESAKMYSQMTGMQNLVFFGQVCGMSRQNCQDRAETLLKQLDLWDAREKKLSAYSTGMAQRLSIARALVHSPKVLFLDEPTAGLDPESAQAVNKLISDLAHKNGVTVFMCTHQLRYAQDICESYGIIDKGSLLACGTLETLSRDAGVNIKAGFRLRESDKLENFQRGQGGWWQTEIQREEDMPGLLKNIVSGGRDVFEARLEKPTLEDVYFKYVEQKEGRQ